MVNVRLPKGLQPGDAFLFDLSEEDVTAMLREADENYDGELSFEEFCQISKMQDEGLRGKLKEAVEQAKLGALAAGAFRSAMLDMRHTSHRRFNAVNTNRWRSGRGRL